MKEQLKRRQHWLPQASYQDNFTTDGKVKTYWLPDDRTKFISESDIKDIAPVNVGLKKDLYESPTRPKNQIENELSTIEAEYGKILDGKIKKNKPLTKYEKRKVALYISTLQYRTFAQKKHIDSFVDQLKEQGVNLARIHNSKKAEDDWNKKMEEAKKFMFPEAVAISRSMSKWSALDFCFLYPASFAKIEFITSDTPVTLVDFAMDNSPYGLNEWSKTAENVVVLTPEIALFGNRCGIKGYKEADYNIVREINNRNLRHADKMLITKSEIPKYEEEAVVQRKPQSLLVKYAKLKKGKADFIISKQKAKERIAYLVNKLNLKSRN